MFQELRTRGYTQIMRNETPNRTSRVLEDVSQAVLVPLG